MANVAAVRPEPKHELLFSSGGTHGKKAVSEVTFANQTDKPVVFKIKCNQANLFSIKPAAIDVLQPQQSRRMYIILSPDADPTANYEVLVQCFYLNPDYAQSKSPNELFAAELAQPKCRVTNAKFKAVLAKSDDPVADCVTFDITGQQCRDAPMQRALAIETSQPPTTVNGASTAAKAMMSVQPGQLRGLQVASAAVLLALIMLLFVK